MVLTTSLRAVVGLAALAAAPHLGAGQTCPAGREEADLGFSGIDCVQCTLHEREGSPHWIDFGAEPTLRQIRAGGPADGKLQDGDVLVAVDGYPITTAAGGHRFSQPEIGKPVRLTVRRGVREVTVDIVAMARCRDEPEPPAPPAAPARPVAPAPPAPPAPPRGWLGFGVQCSFCTAQTQADGTLFWEFTAYPAIMAIDSTGPAARADLRPGDTVRAIDGYGLLTAEGGRRFGAIRPGVRVRLTVQRNGVERVVELTAARRGRAP